MRNEKQTNERNEEMKNELKNIFKESMKENGYDFFSEQVNSVRFRKENKEITFIGSEKPFAQVVWFENDNCEEQFIKENGEPKNLVKKVIEFINKL